jgi:flavin-dependent dehydrogenase
LIPDALHALERLSLKDAVLSAGAHLSSIRIYAPNGTYVRLKAELACVPRLMLDDLLRKAAIDSGSQFLAPYSCIAPIVRDGFVAGAAFRNQSGGEQMEVAAPVTLLATGAAVEPLVAFGVCLRRTPSAVAARVYITANQELREEFDYLCISYNKTICPGYGWIFPVPGNVFNVGVGVYYDAEGERSSRNLRVLLDTFLNTFPPARKLAANSRSMTAMKGAPLRTALKGSRLARPGLLVIGEAAGLTFSFSGEGIGKAIESGLMAADIVSRTLSASIPDVGGAAALYEAQLVRKFKDRFRAYEIAQKWLSHPAFANFLAWRASSGQYVQRHLEGLLTETSDPLALFSIGGLLKSLVQ